MCQVFAQITSLSKIHFVFNRILLERISLGASHSSLDISDSGFLKENSPSLKSEWKNDSNKFLG